LQRHVRLESDLIAVERSESMFRKRVFQFCMAALCTAVAGGGAVAQRPVSGDPRPVSDLGGYTGSELRSIYRQGVGTGFSGSSLNQIALQNAQARVPYVGQTSRLAPSSLGLGSGSSLASKPFSSYSPAPTTSPYLNLFREDLEGESDLNYNTLVRPMLQQQQFNEQMQRQSMEIARRLQSIAAQADFNPQGSTTQYPTGHQTVFNYLGHYYPSAGQRRR
jgi:hypothetical protein